MVRVLRTSLLVFAATALALGVNAGVASAASPTVPYTDTNATGYIGFCNAKNEQITSGLTNAYPFAAKVVSSTPPPKGYTQASGHATLFVYQPIQYVDPGDWSGKQMSEATAFSNRKVPMVQILPADPSIANFVADFPLHWEGFAQFRIYYTAPNTPVFNSQYPAVSIKVTGTTWRQVGGGKVDCSAGQARSDASDLENANVQPSGGIVAPASGSRSSAHGQTGTDGAASGSGAKGATSNGAGSGQSAKKNGGSVSALAVTLIVLFVVASAGAGYAVRRRRRA